MYLQALYFNNRLTRDDWKKAVECARTAVKLDAQFALGWATLSRIYANLANDEFVTRAEGCELARAAARIALELEPRLAEGHDSMGRVQLFFDWDWSAAEASFAGGRPVAVFTTTGPGLLNAVTGVAAARDVGAKVVVLSACTPPACRGRGAIQETSPCTMTEKRRPARWRG